MKPVKVEWSLGKSPESVAEIWSVAATMEAILLILAEDNREQVRVILSKAREGGGASKEGPPSVNLPTKKRRRGTSR